MKYTVYIYKKTIPLTDYVTFIDSKFLQNILFFSSSVFFYISWESLQVNWKQSDNYQCTHPIFLKKIKRFIWPFCIALSFTCKKMKWKMFKFGDWTLTLFIPGGGWFSPPSQFFLYNFWSIHSYTFKFCGFSKLLFESIMRKNFFGKYAALLPWQPLFVSE